MSLTLGNPTALETALRESIVSAVNTALNVGAGANAILRLRNSTTTLVDWTLNAANPLTLGASDGQATVNPTSASATATGGTATVPDNYQLLDKDATVRISGPVTGGDGITTGQAITLNTTTITMPAS